MRLVCLFVVVLMVSQPVAALTLPPGISPGSEKFHGKTRIKAEANRARYNSTGPEDYFYKGTLLAAELFIPTFIGGKLLARNAVKTVFGTGLKKAGASSSGISFSKKILTQGIKRVTALKTLKEFFSTHKHLANFIVGTLMKRPTPGGLKLGSRLAIEMAAESYYHTSKKVPPTNPHLIAAEQHIQNAVNEYNTYTGLLDAFTLTYSKFSPEGFNRIISECMHAVDDLRLAKKAEQPSAITVS